VATQTIEDASITPSRTVAVSADGTTAYLAAQVNTFTATPTGTVSVVTLATGEVTTTLDVFGHAAQSSFVDASGLIWIGNNGNLTIWDPSDNSVESIVGVGGGRAMLLDDGNAYTVSGSTLRELSATNQGLLRSTGLSEPPAGHGLDLVR
jgi:hypothetical protein